jgi:7-keto-8-aminopelargonate synthetase-like enzyme
VNVNPAVPALSRGLADFRDPRGKDLIARCEPLGGWVDDSRSQGVFPFIRYHTSAPDKRSEVVDFGGHRYSGLNLGSQDYLGLARDERVGAAAAHACKADGTHSAGSEPMGGGFRGALELTHELAEFLATPNVVLFPSGWGAGYGAIKALVRPYDRVLIDALAHDCLQQGAHASTPNVALFAHNDLDSLRKRLHRIRASDTESGILVITESLFSMDSDHPDFRRLIEIVREFEAALLVDVAHDLGVLGPGGRGVLAEASVLGEADIVIGSFSKSFACLGGFVATRSTAASYYVRGFSGTYTFSNYLMPAQVAAVRAALGIIRSPEGDALRAAVLENASELRRALTGAGVPVSGRVSPIVLPRVGSERIARLTQRLCLEKGLILNSIEFPACRRGEARFRLQVSPRHEAADLRWAASVVAESLATVSSRVNQVESA